MLYVGKTKVTPVIYIQNNGLKYGCRRLKDTETQANTSPKLERLWDAIDMVANAGVDDEIVRNDFDSVYPWSEMKRCNISVVEGKIVVNAYEGEPNYTTDGSNGNVVVEVPKFYQPPRDIGDGYEYWGVGEHKFSGW